MVSADYFSVLVEQGELFKIDYVLSVAGVALGEDRHSAANDTARSLNQLFNSKKGLARGDNVVNYKDLFALHKLCVVAVDVKMLFAVGGD